MKKKKPTKRQNPLTLEAKVRALKLLKVDKWNIQETLEDIENTFGITLEDKVWDEPKRFLKKIEEEVQRLYLTIGPHRQRLVKLLLQAELIEEDSFKQNKNGDQNG